MARCNSFGNCERGQCIGAVCAVISAGVAYFNLQYGIALAGSFAAIGTVKAASNRMSNAPAEA